MIRITETLVGRAHGRGEFTSHPKEAHMKKLYVLAALLMVSTAAHAGNSISFEIEGHKIRIEAPKNCGSLSSSSSAGSGRAFPAPALASRASIPVALTTTMSRSAQSRPHKNPPPPPSIRRRRPSRRRPRRAAPRRTRRRLHRPRPRPRPATTLRHRLRLRLRRRRRSRPPSPPRRFPRQPRRSVSGPPKKTREPFASNSAGKISADMPQTPAKRF